MERKVKKKKRIMSILMAVLTMLTFVGAGAVLGENRAKKPEHNHTPILVEGTPATCVKAGLSDGKICADCGMVLVEQVYIAPSGKHTPKTIKGIPATCATAGTTDKVVCAVCNAVITAQKEIPALGHLDTDDLYADGCSRCGLSYWTPYV